MLHRLVRVTHDVELAERAGGDDNLRPGLFDLRSPALSERCGFLRVPGSYTAAAPAADGRHLHDVDDLPDQLPGLVADTLPPQQVAGVVIGCPDVKFRRRLDAVLREELVDVGHLERRLVIVLERGTATGAHGQHRVNAP